MAAFNMSSKISAKKPYSVGLTMAEFSFMNRAVHSPACKFGTLVTCFFIGFSAVSTAAPSPTPTPAAKPSPAASISPTPAPSPGPTPMPDTFDRYGRILSIGDEPSHPLKLNMPFPNVGEIKIPTPDELTVRIKLEELANLSDADILTQLEQWPAFAKMKLADEGTLLVRIQQFKERRTRMAMEKAHQMGLNTLTPEQQARFEKEYWDKRLQMDRDLAKQFQPVVKDHEQKMQEDLFREFSSLTSPGASAQAPKSPPVPPPTAKPTPSPH